MARRRAASIDHDDDNDDHGDDNDDDNDNNDDNNKNKYIMDEDSGGEGEDGFPMGFLWVSPWVSCGFPIGFLWASRAASIDHDDPKNHPKREERQGKTSCTSYTMGCTIGFEL